MVTTAHKFKLSNVPSSIYGSFDGQWAFAYRTAEGFSLLTNPMHCKDYSHEILANIIHGANIFHGGETLKYKITPEEIYGLRLAIFFKLKEKENKKHLFSVKKYLNIVEKACDIKQTLITEVSTDKALNDDCRAFILTFPKVYIESPALFHALIAFMRTLKSIDTEVTDKNIETILNDPKFRQDIDILKFMVKHDIFKIIMSNHDYIFKGLSLKDIYPAKVTNPKGAGYHSGFGMVSLCGRVLSSLEYAQRTTDVLTQHKIPNYGRG